MFVSYTLPNRAIIFLLALLTTLSLTEVCAKEKSKVEERRVTIAAGDVLLGASLYRPGNAKGDLPAIVTAHGSAPSTREGVGFYTHRALEMGFAVLSFDKRGTGESTGAYEPFTVAESARVFQDLAMDVVWSARWLAEQDGIDETRIGLFGGSQAGWIMPLAASLEPAVSFIIIGEGNPVTAGEEAIHGHYLVAQTGSEAGAESAIVAQADAILEAYDGDHGFDPAPALEALDIPVLWIFGLRDSVIPVIPSLTRLETLIKSGKTNHEVHVFAFGDHSFNNTATGGRYDVTGVAEPWLREIGVLD